MAKRSVSEPDFRPRLGGKGGGRVSAQRIPNFCQSVLQRARQRFTRMAKAGAVWRGAGVTADVREPLVGSRRCVIKDASSKSGKDAFLLKDKDSY